MVTRTLLMVDDAADDFFLIQSALRDNRNDIGLRLVEDGEEMMDYLHKKGKFETAVSFPRPFFIHLDLNMPRMDGKEALQEIKGDPSLRRIPVVVFTASNDTDDILSSYRLGANSFIVNPTSFDPFVGVLASLMDCWGISVELPVL